MYPSILSLRHRHPLWHQRPDSRRRQQRILPSRSRLLPGHRQQRRHFRPSLDCLPLNHDLRAWHVPHSTLHPLFNRKVNADMARSDASGGP